VPILKHPQYPISIIRHGNSPNAFKQEQSLGLHYTESNDILDYISNKNVFQYADSFVSIAQGPGLGVKVNEAYIIKRATDGSFAEW
jgi:galactonate dehydratase